ncbi:DUF6049 family protein [Saccharothrix algeriensis]|uniref:Glycoprotein n=1 Tax=Saccharothrix algeriensis TaxID=173560 RepID=A0A8T8I5C2_9PSEU|nr:DUF6049 family protein [Saccharothrix algeriensis]MBM7812200.1 hypothetical protein [Saccharothrix algeriensis]QTR05831.1 hypothetical protein J7S33_15795 [Saccharothrix algeriensis]
MKRLLSALAAAGFLLAGTPASAAPADGGRIPVKPAPATQVWATRPASLQPGSNAQPLLRLDIEELAPRVVTAGADSVTITGKVVNVGDRDIFDIDLRLERGEALTDEEALRGALREPADAGVRQPWFTRIVDELRVGQSRPFALTVPVTGTGNTSLRVEQPGVYPVLANINGRPDYGDRARLAALSTLLPVLAVPGGAALSPPANPAKLTVLWPLADRPRMVSGGQEPVLTDDELATSLALGGRLHSLLMAYESALDGPLSPAVCLAVDPDLLRTVQAMGKGYQVRGRGPGKGRNDAELWLARLKLLASGRCVVALPDADADLVALSRAKLTELSALAGQGAEVVRQVLDVQALPGLAWPEDGVLDQQALSDLAARGVTSLVLDQSAVAGTPGTGPVRLDPPAGKPLTAVRIDGMVSDALRGPAAGRTVTGITTPAETRPVSVQNALAALAFRTGFQGNGQNVVISPPRRWNAPTGEVNTFLQITKSLVAGGFATTVGVEALLGAAPPEQVAALSYPVEAGAQEVPPAVTAEVGRSWQELGRLAESMSQEDALATKPADLVSPLRLSLLRAVSGAWRGDEAGARAALAIAEEQLAALRGQVTVSEPNSPILLASGDSPIPVTIRNRLDVRITVRVVVEDTPGIVAQQLGDQVLPARGDRQLTVPVDVLRSGRFPVHVRLTTPDGVELGERARLEVSSSAYGTITIVITALAGALLVLLSARRIYRRARASRAAAAAVPNDASGVTPEKSSTS